jgi:hypothetical protein
MAGNREPIFPLTPRLDFVQIATANTARDGTGTMGDVIAAGVEGTAVRRVHIKATVTTTAGMVRLFIYDGTNTRLLDEIVVAAVTVGAAVPGFSADRYYDDLILENGQTLRASTHNAETFNVFATAADY